MKQTEIDKILGISPCEAAVNWLKSLPDTETLVTAWLKCERGDWMLWLAGKTCGPVNTDGHRKMTAAKCRCARLVLHIFEERRKGDLRPRQAIEAAEKYAGGQVYSASSAASYYAAASYAASAASSSSASASSASASYYAASSAASSASAPSSSSSSSSYVAAAASYAASYAASADDASADWKNARSSMLAKCADEIRVVFPAMPMVMAEREAA